MYIKSYREKKSPSLSRSRQVLWHMRHHMGDCWIVGLNLALAKAVLSKRYFELFSYSLQELIKYHMKQTLNPPKAFSISTDKNKSESCLIFTGLPWGANQISCNKVTMKFYNIIRNTLELSLFKIQIKYVFLVSSLLTPAKWMWYMTILVIFLPGTRAMKHQTSKENSENILYSLCFQRP